MYVCCRFLVIKNGALGPFGSILLGWSSGREKAAGSLAELKVLVTQRCRGGVGERRRLMKTTGGRGPRPVRALFCLFLSTLSSVDKGLLPGLWGLGEALAMKEEREMGKRTGEAEHPSERLQ